MGGRSSLLLLLLLVMLLLLLVSSQQDDDDVRAMMSHDAAITRTTTGIAMKVVVQMAVLERDDVVVQDVSKYMIKQHNSSSWKWLLYTASTMISLLKMRYD